MCARAHVYASTVRAGALEGAGAEPTPVVGNLDDTLVPNTRPHLACPDGNDDSDSLIHDLDAVQYMTSPG